MSYIGNNLQSGRSEVFHFTASGGESSITTASDGRSLLYTVGWCSVYLNGVRLHESDFTATTGNSITGLSPALSANDVVIVEAMHTFSVDSSVPSTGGTFSGAVTVPTPTATGHATTKAYVDSAATTATTAAQGVGTGNAVTFATVNTGHGNNNLYGMDQTVLIASLPTFSKLTLTNGLLFGTDTAAANTLNDYEEGNWTPACSAATIQVVNATYTKIGNSVRLGAYINIDSTGSGDFALTGVPFTNTSVGGAAGAVFIRNFSANKNGSVAAVIGGGTTVYLRVGMQDNAGNYLLGEVADTVSFWLGITYETSA